MNKNLKISYLTKGSMYIAISFIIIYLSSIVPINKFYLMSISSCIIPICILTTNLKTSMLVFISTSILSSILIGISKVSVIAYITFFGIYGVIKLYIEKINKLYIELILKFIYFNISIFLTFIICKTFIFNIKLPQNLLILYFIILQLIFLVFDYILTLFIHYFNTHILKNIK